MKTIENFKGLKYRQQTIYKKNDIEIINDSKSTSYSSSIELLKSSNNIYWLLAGIPKKGDKFILPEHYYKNIKGYVIGKYYKKFQDDLKNKIELKKFSNLSKALTKIYSDIRLDNLKKKTILFSPAGASFDKFKNFEDRGFYFNKIIQKNLMINKAFNYFSYYQWWKNLDKFLLSLIMILFLVGLFFSLVSTSLIASNKLETNSYFFFFKHLFFVIIGLGIIFILSYVEQKILYKYSIFIFLITLLLLILVPIIGVEVKGSKRWLDIFFLPRIQPIEFVKPFFIIMISTIIAFNKINNFSLKFIITLFLTIFISALLIIQPDLGQTLLLGFTWLILIFISGVNLMFIFIVSVIGLVFLLYFAFYVPKFEYVKNRILSFLDSETGTYNFQSDKALDSIISGGFSEKELEKVH